jgi:SAM-dependent methyltransferase
VETEVRERHGRWGAVEWPEFPAMFEERLAAEDLEGRTVLDVGTGEGRLALHLAPRAKLVVGIDRDEEALAAARETARTARIANVTFLAADADTANYRLLVRSPIDCVVASYFMSEACVRNAAGALRPGGRLVFACHHADNWRETGHVGRYAFSRERMEDVLAANGFAVEFLGVDRTVIAYDGLEQLAEAHPILRKRWGASGRWADFAAKVGSKPFQLTWATLVGVATFRMTKIGQNTVK